MKSPFKNWWLVLLKGILLIVLSIIIFRNPVATIMGLSIYLGIGLLFAGVFEMVTAYFLRDLKKGWGWSLAGGAIDILFGLVLIANPEITVVVLPFVLGFWVLFYGVLYLAASLADRKEEYVGPQYGWLGGAITILVGLLILFNPTLGIATITVMIGLGFLILGIISVMVAMKLRTIKKVFE